MESCSKSIKPLETREKTSGKCKRKKKSKRQTHTGRISREEANDFDNRMVDELTELDEAERLCLPNYNKDTSDNKVSANFPKHYNAQKYLHFDNAEERLRYRNWKDLRNNMQCSTLKSKSILEDRPCFTQLRVGKCLDSTCIFNHEFRLPRKLRLCHEWMNGLCADGDQCFYLHSEYPCRFHYLGLNSLRHDPKTCPYYHGGPLPKEYEEMFLNAINLTKFPNAREMYRNQIIRLKRNAENGAPSVFNSRVECKRKATCTKTSADRLAESTECVTVLHNKSNDSVISGQEKEEESDGGVLVVNDTESEIPLISENKMPSE